MFSQSLLSKQRSTNPFTTFGIRYRPFMPFQYQEAIHSLISDYPISHLILPPGSKITSKGFVFASSNGRKILSASNARSCGISLGAKSVKRLRPLICVSHAWVADGSMCKGVVAPALPMKSQWKSGWWRFGRRLNQSYQESCWVRSWKTNDPRALLSRCFNLMESQSSNAKSWKSPFCHRSSANQAASRS